MEIIYPAYYPAFRCIASACPDSCCHEWTVDVDATAAQYYRSLPGALGDRLRQVLRDTDDGTVMEIENDRCPMWRQDGLCRIQAELGHDALCQTCRSFPRLRHDYGDFMELGLELSCPEAARLILTEPGYVEVQERQDGGGDPDYDTELMQILKESRTAALQLVESEAYPIPETLASLLLYGHTVQAQVDGGEGESPDFPGYLREAKGYAAQSDRESFLRFFQKLEILTDRWETRLYAPGEAPSWDPAIRRVAAYLIRRYWLQAVSDYDLISRVKLTVCLCLLLAILGGDPVCTAQLMSKELENDLDNLEAILDGAYTAPALTDVNLLSLLLNP